MNYFKCYLSEIGHNNFFYPSETTAMIAPNCEYSVLPWIGGKEKNLTPIKIKKSCVVPSDTAQPSIVNGATVVWVDNNLLPLSSVG
tara:strand:+ start:11107 stop:11364 length:258 start_codon:yes stop_codon:yes gene_type:complete